MNSPTPRPITPRSTVVASEDQVSSDLAGETVLLSMLSARYYGFEGVGSRIWELVRQPIVVAAVSATIAQEYEVELARCETDVLAFLGQLAERGLIEVRGGA